MQPFHIPEPSRLFSLKPEGIGTPFTESLASYAMRLAEAHCINVCDLIHRFIHPLVGSAWKDTPSQRRLIRVDRVYKHVVTPAHMDLDKWLNISRATEATVAALSELTKRGDLHLLTLLPLSGYVKKQSILRFQRAWCPCCYEEQKNTGKPVHDLLIWSFQDVCMCIRHEQRLQSACFWCHAKQPILKYRSQPGFCSRCDLWLGRERIMQHGGFTSKDFWNAKAIGHLISNWDRPQPYTSNRPTTLQKVLANTYETKDIIEGLPSTLK